MLYFKLNVLQNSEKEKYNKTTINIISNYSDLIKRQIRKTNILIRKAKKRTTDKEELK